MPFKDFIPAGHDIGAQGDGGFRDFQPEPKPQPPTAEELEQIKQETVKEEPVKKGKKQ